MNALFHDRLLVPNDPVFVYDSAVAQLLIHVHVLMQDMSYIKFDDGRAGSGYYCIALYEDAATKARIVEQIQIWTGAYIDCD